jgi:hypothetical protein
LKKKKQRIPGVFPHLVNAASFVDVIDIALWGVRRINVPGWIQQKNNLAIGGPGRAYARCIRGVNKKTGNRLQFRYGKFLPYKNVSPFALSVRSDRLPVTCADVELAIAAFLRLGYKATVSRIEFTFDVKDIPLDLFARELCTTARTFKEFESDSGTTLYAGGPRSPLQLKIYQKTYAIVRSELTLRSVFLRRHGIVRPQEAFQLRKARLWDHVSFREVNQSDGDALPTRIRKHWTRLGHGLPPDMPAAIVLKSLRESRADPSRWLVRSPREVLLRKMQHSMIW